MNLLLFDTDEVDREGGQVRVRDRRAEHLRSVLGVAVGTELRAGVVRGETGRAVVEEVTDREVWVRFDPAEPAPREPATDLVLAVPRPKVLSRVLQHAAAFGVGRIDLVNAWRVDKSYLDSPRLEVQAMSTDLRLGCEQGGHTWVPEVRLHRRLMPFVDGLPADSPRIRLLAHPRGGVTLDRLAGELRAKRSVVAIGPEGGWIDREVDTLRERGFAVVSLSRSVLRTEAAVTAALAELELLRAS